MGKTERIAVFVVTALAAGCAGTVVRPISAAEDATADGIRYYESAPFLLVSTDGRGGIESRILYLPDVTAIRSVDPYATLAKNGTTLTFTNGVLSQSKTVIDETVVPSTIVTALETAAKAALAAANAPDQAGREVDLPLPQLYRIVIEANGAVSLRGGNAFAADGTPLQSLRATISRSSDGSTPKQAVGEGREKEDEE